MPNTKRCLIVDDENQSAEIERLISIGKSRGLVITCDQFNVGSQKQQDLFIEGKLNREKINEAFNKEFKGYYDIIAFDYQLQDPEINGIDLVRLLGDQKKTALKLVYSAMLDNILKDVLVQYEASHSFRTAKARLKALFSVVVEFTERSNANSKTGYEHEIIRILASTPPSADQLLVKKLREYDSMTFRSIYPNFKGKTLGEVAEEIENATPQSIHFQIELIEQAIANMLEMNK